MDVLCFSSVSGSRELNPKLPKQLVSREKAGAKSKLNIMSKIEQDFQKASKEFQRLQAGELQGVMASCLNIGFNHC